MRPGLVVNLFLVPSKPRDFHLFLWSSHDFENFISPLLPRICSKCYEFKAKTFQAILFMFMSFLLLDSTDHLYSLLLRSLSRLDVLFVPGCHREDLNNLLYFSQPEL